MRKKERIRVFCEELATAWEQCPDLRFGQLMFNFFAKEYNSDAFYVEDEELIRKLKEYVATMTDKERSE